MSNNDRAASDDDLSTDMNNDRDDDIVDRNRRDDAADRSRRDDAADRSRRDDAADRSRRDDATDRSRRDDTADRGGHNDTANRGRRDDSVDHSGRDTNDTHERRNANDDHGYRDDNANRERRDDNANEADSGGPGKWLSPLIALLGLWMIAMAFVLDVAGSHFWSAVLVGALLIAVGAYNYSRQANERVANSAIALIAVAAGLWLIAAPYVLGGDAGLSESAYELWFYNHIAVGLLAVGLGAYSAYSARDHQQDTRQTNA